MLPEEWPIAGPPVSHNAPARGGRDRLSTVRVDFFLDPAERLTEQERAVMTAMLHCLVGDIADEVRAALPNGTAPANDDGNLGLVERLVSARLLDRPVLVRLLLRRADEERIATAAKARAGRREGRVLQGLVSHEDGAVAAAAMALILGRGRRRDRFGQCLLHFDDLVRDEAAALVHLVCAALRNELSDAVGPARVDQLLNSAAERVLASHDPGSGLEALTAKLVRLLDEEGDLTDDLIVAGAMEGEMIFVSQALSRRGGLRGNVALDELLSGEETRLMLLLRAGGMKRQSAARLLAGIGDLLAIADAGSAIDAFDQAKEEQVEAARNWLAIDAAFRNAVAALGPNG